ncbi:MAG TPA: serine hydrolase [Bacteroidota bacterium]|nr:serine hydrolase [Bacteroidota bacterium]
MNQVKQYVMLFLLVIVVSGVNTAVTAQTIDKHLADKVDSLFSQFNSSTPGCAIGIMQDGKIIYEKGYGLANLEYNVPITPQTIFHMASVSKQFTAFAIVLLAQQGKISLNDDIRTYLPEVPDFGTKITINHLLHHTSGLRDQWELLMMSGFRLDDVITTEHILKLVAHQKELNFAPGDEFMYCNTGYTLLGEIVKRVSGKSFDEFTRENMFTPLGMTNTHFHMDHEEIVRNRAYSYNQGAGGTFKNAVLSYANGGATSLFTTIDDMAHWVNNFSTPVVGGTKAIDQMMEKGVLTNGTTIDYAFGLGIDKYKGLNRIAHGGGDAGFRTNVTIFPDQKFAVIIFSNAGYFDPGRSANMIADIFLADRFQGDVAQAQPKERKEVAIDPKVLEPYAGSYSLFPGFTLTVTQEGGKLMVQATGQEKFEVYPESETEFFYKVVDAQITFEQPIDGKCNKLTLHQGGRNMPGNRMLQSPPGIDDLREYEGNYYSEELGTSIAIAAKDSSLRVIDRRNEDLKLNVELKDVFSANMATIKFTRNEKNKISGLQVTSGRVRKLTFVKQ